MAHLPVIGDHPHQKNPLRPAIVTAYSSHYKLAADLMSRVGRSNGSQWFNDGGHCTWRAEQFFSGWRYVRGSIWCRGLTGNLTVSIAPYYRSTQYTSGFAWEGSSGGVTCTITGDDSCHTTTGPLEGRLNTLNQMSATFTIDYNRGPGFSQGAGAEVVNPACSLNANGPGPRGNRYRCYANKHDVH